MNRQMNRMIKDIYRIHGGGKYMIQEPITQSVHAVQTSIKVKELGGDENMQLAGLLHDIGHIIMKPIDPCMGVNDHHEYKAFKWLRYHYFPNEISYPILNHVEAKRYLCSTEWGYYESLSKASRLSFELQGGFMTNEEKWKFEDKKYFLQSLLLRKADDQSKDVDIKNIPEFDTLLDELFVNLRKFNF